METQNISERIFNAISFVGNFIFFIMDIIFRFFIFDKNSANVVNIDNELIDGSYGSTSNHQDVSQPLESNDDLSLNNSSSITSIEPPNSPVMESSPLESSSLERIVETLIDQDHGTYNPEIDHIISVDHVDHLSFEDSHEDSEEHDSDEHELEDSHELSSSLELDSSIDLDNHSSLLSRDSNADSEKTKKKRRRSKKKTPKDKDLSNGTSSNHSSSRNQDRSSSSLSSHASHDFKSFRSNRNHKERQDRNIMDRNWRDASETGRSVHHSPPRRFSHSMLHLKNSDDAEPADSSSIRPIRQPFGPSIGTNGFSEDYRRSRHWHTAS